MHSGCLGLIRNAVLDKSDLWRKWLELFAKRFQKVTVIQLIDLITRFSLVGSSELSAHHPLVCYVI